MPALTRHPDGADGKASKGGGATPAQRGGAAGFSELVGWLMLIWICLSDKYDVFHLTIGLGSAVVVAALTIGLLRDGLGADARGRPAPRYLFRFPWRRAHTFFPWFMWQILVSNVHVAATILSRRLPIEPRLVRLPVRLECDLGRLVLANAITLTPGTCVVDVEGSTYVVHALTADSAASLPLMHDRVARLFGESTDRSGPGRQDVAVSGREDATPQGASDGAGATNRVNNTRSEGTEPLDSTRSASRRDHD